MGIYQGKDGKGSLWGKRGDGMNKEGGTREKSKVI